MRETMEAFANIIPWFREQSLVVLGMPNFTFEYIWNPWCQIFDEIDQDAFGLGSHITKSDDL